jgi:tetratricopeptide (TPR) repeat protein
MRRIALGLVILVGGLANAGPLRAGVYNLDPPPSIYRSDFVESGLRNPTSVLSHLNDLRAINEVSPNPGLLREGYLRQAAELHDKERAGTLSAEDRVNLGACLIRLGRLGQARTVLEEAARVVPESSPAHFLVLLNLTSAYQDEPELLPRAIMTQARALKAWPEVRAGWSSAESDWYRRAETYALKLLQLRQAEMRAAGGRPVEYKTVDALFPGVPFVGPGGRYEAGAITFESRNNLPLDAESLVIQLLLWQPSDNRLYWLYGELLNARGAVDFAIRILRELVNSRQMRAPELLAHRRVLLEAEEEFTAVQEFVQKPASWEPLLWLTAPRGQLLVPGIGAAANETAWAAAYELAAQPPTPPPAPAPPAPAAGDALPDWRHVTVSFLAGAVAAVLGALQWQQWRRRRVSPDPDAPKGPVAGPASSYSRPADG